MHEKGMFRYEKKYLINNLQVMNYQSRIEAICPMDSHAQLKGKYDIRSLYFDDYYDSVYDANESGIDHRGKWRFRVYDGNDRLIRLEHKMKENDKVHKDSALVTRDFCEAILAGKQSGIEYPSQDKVVNQFLFDYFTKGLYPAVIVEYERIPYVYKDGDVRVTFDMNIAYSGEYRNFFSPRLHLTPLMESGKQILEVKYTEFIPSIIHNVMNMGNMQQIRFSKFYLSLKNEKMKGVIK